MQVVDTSASKNYDVRNDAGLTAAASYAFVKATNVLTITDASTIPAGDTFRAMVITVTDQKGATKSGRITAAAGNATIDLDAATSLDLTGPVSITAALVTDKAIKDGSVYGVSVQADTSGSLAFEA